MKPKKRVRLTKTGRAFVITGAVLEFIAPIAVAVINYVYIIDSTTARVSFIAIIVFAALLLGAKFYIDRKTEGLRVRVANYETEANLSDGERLTRALAFYKAESLFLNILDHLMLIGLMGLIFAVCFVAEKGLAKLATTLGICFLCMIAGAVASIIGKTMLRGEEKKE